MGNQTDREKAYAAGYLEGYVTQQRIYEYWFNNLKPANITDKSKSWMLENLAWMQLQV